VLSTTARAADEEGVTVRKVFNVRSHWLEFGFGLNQFCLGITVNRYQMSLDLGFCWIAVEF